MRSGDATSSSSSVVVATEMVSHLEMNSQQAEILKQIMNSTTEINNQQQQQVKYKYMLCRNK